MEYARADNQLSLYGLKSAFSVWLTAKPTCNALVRNRLNVLSATSGWPLRNIDASNCFIEPCYTPTSRGTQLAGVRIIPPTILTGFEPVTATLHLVEVDFSAAFPTARPAANIINELADMETEQGSRHDRLARAAQKLADLYTDWQSGLNGMLTFFGAIDLTFAAQTGTLELRDATDTLPQLAVHHAESQRVAV